MALYFLLLDEPAFAGRLVPPLADAYRRRNFAPCRALCASLLPAAAAFRDSFFAGPAEPLLARVVRGVPFDRTLWRAVVGEVLLFAAAEVPELETAPEALACLLAPGHGRADDLPRAQLAPVQQAHFGSRDLVFGPAAYRPEHVGLNDLADTRRLADYLAGVDPNAWGAADLAGLREVDDAERAEELEYVREWFPALRDVYRRAAERGQVVVCEVY